MGYLNLVNCKESVVCNLPKGLRIDGSIVFPFFQEYSITLPDDMIVTGMLNVTHHRGELSLPEGLRVRLLLNLSYSYKLETIPKNLKVGRLNLFGCKNLRNISDDLKVKYKIGYDNSTLFIRDILPLRLHSKLSFFEDKPSTEKK